MAQPTLAIIALVIVTVALIGQAIEMRKIRIRKYGEDSIGHPNIYSWIKKISSGTHLLV